MRPVMAIIAPLSRRNYESTSAAAHPQGAIGCRASTFRVFVGWLHGCTKQKSTIKAVLCPIRGKDMTKHLIVDFWAFFFALKIV